MIKAIQSFWFPKITAKSLGQCRFFFFIFSFFSFFFMDFTAYIGIKASYWFPYSFFHFFPVPTISETEMAFISILWKLSLLFSALGIFTPISLFFSSTLALFLFGLRSGFGGVFHTQCLFILSSFIFLFSRCSDDFSLDRLWKKNNILELKKRENLGIYGWPIILGRVLLVWSFFAAANAKIALSGFQWATKDSLLWYLTYANELYWGSIQFSWQRALNLWLRESAIWRDILAKYTIILEFSAPLALFSVRLARVIIPALLLLQVGIFFFMYLNWIPMMICYLFWWPWRRVS